MKKIFESYSLLRFFSLSISKFPFFVSIYIYIYVCNVSAFWLGRLLSVRINRYPEIKPLLEGLPPYLLTDKNPKKILKGKWFQCITACVLATGPDDLILHRYRVGSICSSAFSGQKHRYRTPNDVWNIHKRSTIRYAIWRHNT